MALENEPDMSHAEMSKRQAINELHAAIASLHCGEVCSAESHMRSATDWMRDLR